LDALKGNRFLHLIQPIDKAEANCLTIGREPEPNGKVAGCGDVWQGGLQDIELACYNGHTYLKCHIDCINAIYKHKTQYTNGPCSEDSK